MHLMTRGFRLYPTLFVLAGLALAGAAQAELTVVADYGGAPALPYYAAIKAAGVSEADAYSAMNEARALGPISEADMLPVHSRRLAPGPVAARRPHLPAHMTAFFLLGTDALSRRWLKQRATRLLELHAVGLVVDVDSAAQLRQLRRLGNGLVLRPVAGDDLAERLNLSHYPVLITATAIQQ